MIRMDVFFYCQFSKIAKNTFKAQNGTFYVSENDQKQPYRVKLNKI